jgi:hypothetical protein
LKRNYIWGYASKKRLNTTVLENRSLLHYPSTHLEGFHKKGGEEAGQHISHITRSKQFGKWLQTVTVSSIYAVTFQLSFIQNLRDSFH